MEIIRREPKNKGLFNREYEFIKGALYVGYGINLRNPRTGKKFREVDIYKSPQMRSTHLIVLGRSRWGKTRFMERAEVDDIESGFSIFSLDPKGDFGNLEAILDAVLRTERYEDFMLFSPLYPDVSVKINPFKDLLPDAISDIVKAISPAGKEPFFIELGSEMAKAVSTALYLKGYKEIRFIDLFQYTTLSEILKLYEEVKDLDTNGTIKIGSQEVSKEELKLDGMISLNKLKSKDRTYWSKVNTSIEIILSQISTGETGKVFGRAKGNPLRERMIKGYPYIFSSILGSLYIGKDPAYRMSRMINASHEKMYGDYYKTFGKLNPPVSEYWDEGSVSIYEGAFEKINKVGGAGGYIHVFTQSFSDFNLNVGKEGAKVFFDNADVVLFSVIDQDTAEYFSRSAGEVYKSKPMWTKDEGIIAVPEKTRLIPSHLFMQMPKGAFNGFIEGSWYRGYSPMLTDKRRIIIDPLPYENERLTKYFAEKYKISENEAVRLIREHEVYYDYDWIMKEDLADLWIDLKEFPYYKNYVRDYKDDIDAIIVNIRNFDNYENEFYLTDTAVEKLKKILNKKFGNLIKAFIEDGILYVHYHSFSDIFKTDVPVELVETKEINGHEYKYIPINLSEEELEKLTEAQMEEQK